METLEAEVSRLKSRLRIYEPNSELLKDEIPSSNNGVEESEEDSSTTDHQNNRPAKKPKGRTSSASAPAGAVGDVNNSYPHATSDLNGYLGGYPNTSRQQSPPTQSGHSRQASPLPFNPLQTLTAVSTSPYAQMMVDNASSAKKSSHPFMLASSAVSSPPPTSFASPSPALNLSSFLTSPQNTTPSTTTGTSSSLTVSKAWNQYLLSMHPVVQKPTTPSPNK